VSMGRRALRNLSLGYLGDEEDTRALAEIGRVLRPDGRLVIEIMHRDLLVRRFTEHDWHLLGEGRLMLDAARRTCVAYGSRPCGHGPLSR